MRTLLELSSHYTVCFLSAIKQTCLKLTLIDGTVIINVLAPNQTKVMNVFCVLMCCHIAVRNLVLYLLFSSRQYWLVFLWLQTAFRIAFDYNSAVCFVTIRPIYNIIFYCNVCSHFCTTFFHVATFSLPKFLTLLPSYFNTIFYLFQYVQCTQLPSVTLAFIRIKILPILPPHSTVYMKLYII